MTDEDETPEIESLVVDTRSSRLAVVKDVRHHRLYLRPPGGGREWEAMPQHVRPADEQEKLRARVAAENADSSRRRAG